MANSTGYECQQAGIYQTDCVHKCTMALSKGERFPPCPHGHFVVWILKRVLVNSTGMTRQKVK